MVFYILISVVFIAEIIIAASVAAHLLHLSRKFRIYSSFLEDAKPDIQKLFEAGKKLSEQMLEAAPAIKDKIQLIFLKIIEAQLKNLLAGITFWAVKREVEKRLNL